MIAISALLDKKQKEVDARKANTTLLIDADQITVTRCEDAVTIRTPYDQKFVKALKYYCRSARWNADSKVWTVTADKMDRALEIIAECYHAARLPEGTTVMEALAARGIHA